MFRVTTTTIARWSDRGVLAAVRASPAGHRRFRADDVWQHMIEVEEAEQRAREAREAKRLAGMWIHRRLGR